MIFWWGEGQAGFLAHSVFLWAGSSNAAQTPVATKDTPLRHAGAFVRRH